MLIFLFASSILSAYLAGGNSSPGFYLNGEGGQKYNYSLLLSFPIKVFCLQFLVLSSLDGVVVKGLILLLISKSCTGIFSTSLSEVHLLMVLCSHPFGFSENLQATEKLSFNILLPIICSTWVQSVICSTWMQYYKIQYLDAITNTTE